MTKESEKEAGGEAQDDPLTDEEGHAKASPPFERMAFAHDARGGPPSPSAGTAAEAAAAAARPTPREFARPMMPTLTDPIELETARQRSADSGLPPPRRQTPQGLLSLANARIPSNLPPPHRPIKESSSAVAAVDREWEELATRPPPPLQQDLIDQTARTGPAASAPPGGPGVAPAPAPASAPATAQEMNDRVALGDYTGALEIAEKLLQLDPGDAEAAACAESCKSVLRQMYATRIGPLDRAPVVMLARDQLRWLTIDHRAGFVLSLVDGVSSVEMILDVSGMPALDTLRILSELAQQRIIAFR